MQILLWLGFILPWFSLVLLKKEDIKRYMPVTILTSLIMTIIFEIAYTYDWWIIHQTIMPWGYITNVVFNYGIFAVGTLWIFYLTSHHFLIYMLTNFVINVLFAFIGIRWIVEGLGIATFNLESWQWFGIAILVSLIIYGYHRWQEKVFVSPEHKH